MAKRQPKSGAPEGADQNDEANPEAEGEAALPEPSNVEKYLEQNSKKIAILAIVALLAVAVLAWITFSGSKKNEQAARDFFLLIQLSSTTW